MLNSSVIQSFAAYNPLSDLSGCICICIKRSGSFMVYESTILNWSAKYICEYYSTTAAGEVKQHSWIQQKSEKFIFKKTFKKY